MSIATLLKEAEKGELSHCKDCPWRPSLNEKEIAFGTSCAEHGLRWQTDSKANSMIILQDPGDTTPQATGRLCSVHNEDNTAQHSLHLWKAAVSLDWNDSKAGGYLEKHYFTNAIMHGASKKSGLRDVKNKNMSAARKCCSEVLAEQIKATSPKVIIACGVVAATSLHRLKIISNPWKKCRDKFACSAYHEEVKSWGNEPFNVFCTYHTAGGAVSRSVSELYDHHPIKIEESIDQKANKISNRTSIDQYLEHYSKKGGNTEKGMKVLLNHWLDIGVAIRESYRNFNIQA